MLWMRMAAWSAFYEDNNFVLESKEEKDDDEQNNRLFALAFCIRGSFVAAIPFEPLVQLITSFLMRKGLWKGEKTPKCVALVVRNNKLFLRIVARNFHLILNFISLKYRYFLIFNE